ncbi:hypothetical protein HJG60_008759 [Phyllostomus discolor]|uniref:Uncharacterized protein n=1 Tax=Phyllostomus discolor TaxID=89673 RepID=A0A833YYZ4_9CHIR|nr:hypothetical protein HJG60_008759 [Phyllostomus discolor]
MCLFKAIIKVLYHSLEQQNEFQSRNYCPLIFRIIKASANMQTVPPPSSALPPPPLPLPPSVCVSCFISFMSHFVKLNSARRCWFTPEGAGDAGALTQTGELLAHLQLRFLSLLFLLPVHSETSLPWRTPAATLGWKAECREWPGNSTPSRGPGQDDCIMHRAPEQRQLTDPGRKDPLAARRFQTEGVSRSHTCIALCPPPFLRFACFLMQPRKPSALRKHTCLLEANEKWVLVLGPAQGET